MISLDEWQRYVESDPEIALDSENPSPENFVITVHPEQWPLWWRRDIGEIYTSNPDDEVIAKLVQIAKVLGARVLGDDEEIYGIDASDPCMSQAR